ncbi:MAG TPA: sigma-70 family RNA polymerase sigma factor [Thermoanaerobaculia bacterium]|nr:sigma-70 family RNA polymerase sigma factor [Thermoanaerobaculia bacterium]
MEESDEAAIARVRLGDLDAFRLLVDRHGRSIHRLAYRITCSQEDAQDMTQEAFIKAYRRLDKFDSRASFATWLRCIASNCCLDLLRSRRRRLETAFSEGESFPSRAPGPDRVAQSTDLSRDVLATLRTLSPRERAAFILRHFEGLSIAEIGPALGLSRNGTKQSIFRAVRKLRRALGPHVGSFTGAPEPMP